MTIWLIGPYGPIPGEGWRDYRLKLMGDALAEQGHQVMWWTSGFSHHFKRHRAVGWKDVATRREDLTIRLVPTVSYQGNASLRRLLCELVFSFRVLVRGWRESNNKPDLIIATEPPQLVGFIGVLLSVRSKCPVLFDVMDRWPELFALRLPSFLRPLERLIFAPFYALRRFNFSKAAGVVSLSQQYMDELMKEHEHLRRLPHITVLNGINVETFRAGMRSDVLPAIQLPAKGDAVWAVFAGTLGENYDLPALFEAASICQAQGRKLVFLIAGTGPLAEWCRSKIHSERLNNVVFLGQLSPEELGAVYRSSDIGLCLYHACSNVAMPDKCYDYFAAGLAIVNSLSGELAYVLRDTGAGVQYSAGSGESLSAALAGLTLEKERLAAIRESSYRAASRFDRTSQYRQLPPFVDAVQNLWQSKEEHDGTTITA